MRRGRCRIIASTLGCLVCDKTLTCFLFKTVQMLITMHVALLAFYFNMLIYVEIDVCVVPNWSYVMICDRMFNLKTTCVKKKYLWLIFYLYIWHKFVLFRVGFCFVLCRTFTAGLDWPAECWKRFGKIDFYLFIFFFFFLNLQCEIIETKNAHMFDSWEFCFYCGRFCFGPNDPEGLDPAFETQHTKNCRWVQRWVSENSAAIFCLWLVFKINPEITFFFFVWLQQYCGATWVCADRVSGKILQKRWMNQKEFQRLADDQPWGSSSWPSPPSFFPPLL